MVYDRRIRPAGRQIGVHLPERPGNQPKEEPARIDDSDSFARLAIDQLEHAKRAGNEDRVKRWEAVLKAHIAKRCKMNDEIEEAMLRKAEAKVK